MKPSIPFLLSLLLTFLTLSTLSAQQKGITTVYLVRHAEKDLSNPGDKNPPLTEQGKIRAQHLAEKLKNDKIDVIYSTKFDRTMSTVTPLADQKKLQVKTYYGPDYEALKKSIEADKGKTIVVCGHSDNLLPIIKTLGATPPLEKIADTEYDNLFKVTISPEGKAVATVEKYK
jgi:2,3-bisphosphoglycerate-dependent phosphoglycerate mutase